MTNRGDCASIHQLEIRLPRSILLVGGRFSGLWHHGFKAAFIHVPKAGGTSIAETLRTMAESTGARVERRPDSRHVFPSELRGLPSDYFTFTVVRNPWDRTASLFRWMEGWRGDRDERLASKQGVEEVRREFHRFLSRVVRLREESDRFPSVEGYAADLLDRINHGEVINNRNMRIASLQQISCISDSGQLIVDFIGRFERLHADFGKICDRIGVPRQQLAHLNASVGNSGRQRPYADYYDNSSRELVANLYDADIEIFGYAFE